MKKTIYLSIALMFAVAISEAQIPNAGFETWTSMTGYDNPNSWSCLNTMTSSMSTYTCMKGTPGNPGTAYLKLVSKTITGLGVVPGIAVCGTINTTTFQAQSGFPYSQRPQNLTGNWQHMIFGSSQGYIDVQLTRWDNTLQSRVTVASAHNVLSGMAMSWAAFTIPLVYSDGSNPDSCIIVMASSGGTPTANDYLWVDNLAFSGLVAGIKNPSSFLSNVAVFPNPSSNNISIDLSLKSEQQTTIELTDLNGKVVLSKNAGVLQGTSKQTLDVSSLAKGSYFINIITESGREVKKIVIQ